VQHNVGVVLQLLGLLIGAGGAFTASTGVIVSKDQANKQAETTWDDNPAFRDAILFASSRAKWGLLAVAAGSVLTFLGIILVW